MLSGGPWAVGGDVLNRLCQGRFKSSPIQADGHFLTVCRYVERNALRADLVEHADEWRWSLHSTAQLQ